LSSATPATLQRLLGDEFAQQGWRYDNAIGRDLVDEAVRQGAVDPAALAARVPPAYLERHGIDRDRMTRAIERAIGDRAPVAEPVTSVVNDHSSTVTLGKNASITGNVNVGGTQLNVSVTAEKPEIIAAVTDLVRAGLAGAFDRDAAAELHAIIAQRDDVTLEDVHAATLEAAPDAKPDRGRVRALLTQIAAAGLGGALSTGISSGLGELIHQLPM
jgi:hypothetical protein